MKISYITILLLMAALLSANSVFSPFGTPLSLNGNDVYGLGMGNTGLADNNRLNCSQSNASLLVTASKVTISTAVNMGWYWYKNDVDSYRDDNIYMPYFCLAVPVKSHRLGLSLSSAASGNLDTGRSGISVAGADSLYYDEIIRKREDLFKTSLHYAFKNKIANIGCSVEYYFGNQVNYWSLDFEDASYTDTKYEYEKIYSGINWKLGLNKKLGDLSLGFTWEPSAELRGDYRFRYNFGTGVDTLATDEAYYTVPENYGLGLSYMFSSSLKLNADAIYTLWSDTGMSYESETGEEAYTDVWQIGAGLSYDPMLGYGQWYERIPFRLGCSWKELPFRYEQEEIRELALSAGSTIQLDAPGRKLDLSVRYAQRGRDDNSGLRDESLEITVGITGFDIFKKQLKRTSERDIPKVTPGMEVREDVQ